MDWSALAPLGRFGGNDSGSRMKLKKYLMLVDQESGPLAQLMPRLRELDFRVVRVPDATTAVEFMRTFPKLSMVVVRDTRDADQNKQILHQIRQVQPGLPVVWHGSEGSFISDGVAEVLPLERVTAGDLVACAERLLCQHFYPPDFRALLVEASLSVFSCFGAYATSLDPFLKANRSRLAELSAVIPFSGAQTSGHLVVSATRHVIAGAYLRLFGDTSPPADGALVDVLGECGNRIIGALASYFEKRGRGFNFGVPRYVAGGDSALWQGAHRPAVVVELETANGQLFSELCIDVERAALQLRSPDEALQSGECLFL